MKQRILKTSQITNNEWINLFKVQYINSKDKICNWIFASRKKNPYGNNNPDAVVLIITIDTPEGRKIVVTKEYRVAINDYEYGFPAGLIDTGMTLEQTVEKELKEETGLDLVRIVGKSNTVISSAGLSDESAVMVFIEASGEISKKYQEDVEDIETFFYNVDDIQKLLVSDKKIGAKCWGVLYYFATIGKI